MTMTDQAGRGKRIAALLALVLVAVAGIALLDPIPQPADYHDFADRRTILGIPHFWNVVSNLPFLLVGLYGIRVVLTAPTPGVADSLRPACLLVFAGAVLVGFGSAAYHLAPTNGRLVWDRLPMAISLMAFFAVVVGEYLDPRWGRGLLWPLVAAGIASVLYWYWSELAGRGDLRPYVLVQFLPLLLVALILLLFRSTRLSSRLVLGVLATYAVAKLLEALDGPLFHLIGYSGHPLKHLAAAVGLYLFLLAILRRKVPEF